MDGLKQARDTVQNTLNAYCAPRTRPDGGFSPEDAPPDTTVQFHARILDNLSSFKANSWDLDSVAKIELVEDADLAYKNTYAGWVNLPLNTNAAQAVRDWQEEARATGV